MKVKLIGIFEEKSVDSDDRYMLTEYIFRNTILKDDFDNGEIKGIKYQGKIFFKDYSDIESFASLGYSYEDDPPEYSPEELKNFEFLDSLEKGDVVVFDAELYFDFYQGELVFISLFSTISNIEKYDDKYAADELDLLVKEKEDE